MLPRRIPWPRSNAGNLVMVPGDAIRWEAADAPWRCTVAAKPGRRDSGPGSRCNVVGAKPISGRVPRPKAGETWGNSNVPHAWENSLNSPLHERFASPLPLANYHPTSPLPKPETQRGDLVDSAAQWGRRRRSRLLKTCGFHLCCFCNLIIPKLPDDATRVTILPRKIFV